MSGEAAHAAAIRAEQAAQERADLHELIVARLSDAMDHHSDSYGTGRCDCGYTEPHGSGIGIGLHQLEAAADAVIALFENREQCTDCGHIHGDAMCNAGVPTLRGGVLDEYACNCTGPHPPDPYDGPTGPVTFTPADPPF